MMSSFFLPFLLGHENASGACSEAEEVHLLGGPKNLILCSEASGTSNNGQILWGDPTKAERTTARWRRDFARSSAEQRSAKEGGRIEKRWSWLGH